MYPTQRILTEYEPEQFRDLIYRQSKYDIALLVSASGKIIIDGTTNREHAKPQFSISEKNSRSR